MPSQTDTSSLVESPVSAPLGASSKIAALCFLHGTKFCDGSSDLAKLTIPTSVEGRALFISHLSFTSHLSFAVHISFAAGSRFSKIHVATRSLFRWTLEGGKARVNISGARLKGQFPTFYFIFWDVGVEVILLSLRKKHRSSDGKDLKEAHGICWILSK